MVERVEGPEFSTGAPDEIKAAPNFSAGEDFPNLEQGSTAPTPEVSEYRPTPTVPTSEELADSTRPIAAERAGILNISDSGIPVETQDTMEGIFKDGAEEHE